MEKLADLPPRQFGSLLKTNGVSLRVGAFVTHIRSEIPSVARGIRLLYGEYPLSTFEEFADFHVTLSRPRGLRRWLRPQVLFQSDGHAAFKPLPVNQAFPMLEWGMNWCVYSYAHRYLMIHAAVVEKGGNALILPAPPGSGKSTLCAALVMRGWRLLSDELTLIDLVDGTIAPIPRPVSLKNESIQLIQRFARDAIFSPSVRDTTKGTVAHMKAPWESVARAGEPAVPAWVVFPRYVAGAPTRLVPLSRGNAFMRVADNSFNYMRLGRVGFDTLAGAIANAGCYEFSYSQIDEALEVFSSLEPGRRLQ